MVNCANDRRSRDISAGKCAACLSLFQGVFYLATGVWPLVSMRSFERVTGPKTDKRLVKTAGVVITAVGGALAMAGACRRVSPEIEFLAVASAAGLTAIDIVYPSFTLFVVWTRGGFAVRFALRREKPASL